MSETIADATPLMSDAERIRARAALGLPNRRRRARRNHMVCLAHFDWECMVRDGLATVRRPTDPDGLCVYRLTHAGAEAALDPGERLDPENFLA